jgi:hypothetical protein
MGSKLTVEEKALYAKSYSNPFGSVMATGVGAPSLLPVSVAPTVIVTPLLVRRNGNRSYIAPHFSRLLFILKGCDPTVGT